MKLPAKVWSLLGSVPVKSEPIAPDKPDENPDFGRWDGGTRSITVNNAASNATQISTLCHEMTHVAIWDAGGQNVLTEQQIEFVCDALGSYLGGAALAGYIVLRAPKE